ncbi:tRNA pseudouridine(38-40) synthase TruA, partial [Pseudogracilibacillus sp. SO30301A]|uniref:tRNA pseudouridine(38-40) synthase TruA n=1 Tax=Pseudogracilibacillus sp. SO30301A TaxID=3098291 RepID=UPI00300E4C9A
MQKLKCTVSYDGTNFSGSQIQPNKRTIQFEIEKAIKKIHKGKQIRIYASGRTDTGVHAVGQVFHFETDLLIPRKNWKKALNAILPDDIYIKKVENVSLNFHAQFDAIEKEYRYFVLNNKETDVFKRNYSYFYPFAIDMDIIKQACKLFEGTHDFTSFCSARSTVKGTKVRTLYEVSCEKQADEIVFILRGNGFLYNMVRIIVGVLLDVGSGKLSMNDIEEMFRKRDRSAAGKTVPPTGLFLWTVKYEDD